MMPVLLVADGALQEEPMPAHEQQDATFRNIPATPPQGDTGAVRKRRGYLSAENPLIVADRAARTPAGIAHLIELAEALQAPVIDQGGRMNFPNTHQLNHTARARR